MNIWIDLDNSPHVPFFAPIIKGLKQRGHSVTLTARKAFQVCQLADLFHLAFKPVGRHYGKHTALKIYGSFMRAAQLLPSTFAPKPDFALSHGSRSQLLAAAARGIPTVVIFDYEFARHLFIKPSWVMVPEVIPDAAVHFPKERVLRYPGIKEDVYAPSFKPDASLCGQLGLKDGAIVVTVRPPADEAHYRNPESNALFHAAIEFLSARTETQIVLLPRNGNQERAVRQRWPELLSSRKMIIPAHAVDGLNLVWHSDLVISGGGTMNREAAALGVPVYSIFRGKIGAVDRFLAAQGRLTLIESAAEVSQKVALSRRLKAGIPASQDGTKRALETILNNLTAVAETLGGAARGVYNPVGDAGRR